MPLAALAIDATVFRGAARAKALSMDRAGVNGDPFTIYAAALRWLVVME